MDRPVLEYQEDLGFPSRPKIQSDQGHREHRVRLGRHGVPLGPEIEMIVKRGEQFRDLGLKLEGKCVHGQVREIKCIKLNTLLLTLSLEV